MNAFALKVFLFLIQLLHAIDWCKSFSLCKRYSIKFIETESCLNWINIQPIPCSFISLLLLVGHCDRKECPVYYLSRVITGRGTRYSGRALPHISLCYSEVASLLHVLHSSYCDKMWPNQTLNVSSYTILIGRAARRFLTLAGYDMKCVTPNAMKSKALVDLLAHFPCGEYEYAPPSEQNSQLQYWRKPTNFRKLASNVNSPHVQQNVP